MFNIFSHINNFSLVFLVSISFGGAAAPFFAFRHKNKRDIITDEHIFLLSISKPTT